MKRISIVSALLLALSISLTACENSNDTSSAQSSSSLESSVPEESSDPLFVEDEPTEPQIYAETDGILKLIRNYLNFQYNYFLDSSWIEIDTNDSLETSGNSPLYRATNLTAEQFDAKLKEYTTDELAEKLLSNNFYNSENGKLYTMPKSNTLGWGITQAGLSLDSIERPDDETVIVNFTSHHVDPDTKTPLEDKKITVRLKNTTDGLRVDECEDWSDLRGYSEITIGEYTFGF